MAPLGQSLAHTPQPTQVTGSICALLFRKSQVFPGQPQTREQYLSQPQPSPRHTLWST